MRPHLGSRRELLLATGAVASLAGCIGSNDDDDDPGDDDGDETDDADDDLADDDPADDTDETAADHLDAAREAIQSAYNELEKRDDEAFDNEVFQGHLADAESELDAGNDLATADQETTITELRDVIDYLAPLGEAEVHLEEGFEQFEPGLNLYWEGREPYWEDDLVAEEIDTAAETFVEAVEAFLASQEAFDDTWPYFETAEERLEALEPDVINAFDTADDYAEQLEDVGGRYFITTTLLWFATGNAQGSVGWAHTSTGVAENLREHWDSARSEFETAQEEFQEAESSYMVVDFQTLYEMIPELEEWFDELQCEISHGEVMTTHFIAAVDAAKEGDMDTYDEEAEAGLETPGACHE